MVRDKNIQIKVTQDEKDEITKLMRKEGSSNLSEFIRAAILKRARNEG